MGISRDERLFPMQRINWLTAFFLFSTPVVAAIWGGIHIHLNGVTAAQVLFFLSYLVATSMSVTAGYHLSLIHI